MTQSLAEFLKQPPMSGEERYKHNILRTCEELHGIVTGSLDGVQAHEIVEMRDWLIARLTHWSWPKDDDKRSAYDRLVYRLIEVTLVEVDAMFVSWNHVPLMRGYCDECGGHDCSDLDCELTRRAIFLWDNEGTTYPGGTP